MIGWIKKKLAERLVKKIIKTVAQGNPYILAAVKGYEVTQVLIDAGIAEPGKKRWDSKKNKWVYHNGNKR